MAIHHRDDFFGVKLEQSSLRGGTTKQSFAESLMEIAPSAEKAVWAMAEILVFALVFKLFPLGLSCNFPQIYRYNSRNALFNHGYPINDICTGNGTLVVRNNNELRLI